MYLFKGYIAQKFLKEFPRNSWNGKSPRRQLTTLKTVNRHLRSGRSQTARIVENVVLVDNFE